jgi:hypothetical protein
MQRSEERSSTRQIAFGLCNNRLFGERIGVVRHDIENLIKFPQRFRETTEVDIGTRVVKEYAHIAWVEPLGFVEVHLALVPPASLTCDVGQALRNPAVIWQELTCALKVTYCGVVIL